MIGRLANIRLHPALLALALLAGSPLCAGCSLLEPPAAVSRGQLYQPGDPRYDAFFINVHDEQVDYRSWLSDAKAMKLPILTKLGLELDASSRIILETTAERRETPGLGEAVSETVARSLELARRLKPIAARVASMRLRGQELRRLVSEERAQSTGTGKGSGHAERLEQIRRELSAALDELETIATAAREHGAEAEALATKLRRAWTGKDEPPPPPPAPSATTATKSEETKKPEPSPRRPAPRAPDAEKPASKPPQEIFTP
jgi:hypothetical protein